MSSKETPAEFKYKYAPVGENFLLPPEEHSHSGIVKFDEEEKQMKKKKEEFLQEAVLIGQMAEKYIEESEASERAKEMGLIHKGFGKYGKDKDSPATHKTEDGKLVPFTPASTEGKKKRGVEFSGKTEKEKEEATRHKIKVKTGLTNVKRIRSEKGKAAFTYKYNGKSNEIVFTKGEYKLMVKKHIPPSKIILARIEKSQEEKKAAKKGEAEKKAERKKEYKLKKRELGPEMKQQQKKSDE